MIVAVLDPNVLVSAFPAQRGIPAAIIARWRRGQFELVVSEPILTELEEAWRYSYWLPRFTPDDANEAIASLRALAIVAPLTVEVSGVATHAEDDLILATAVSCGADHLVTGDRRLRAVDAYEGVAILTPREFADLLAVADDQV